MRERITRFVYKNPRVVGLVATLGLALGVIALRAGNEADQTDVAGQVNGNDVTSQIFLPEGRPSEQVTVEPILLPDVLALMKNTGDTQLVVVAQRLEQLYAFGSVAVVDELLPEESNLQTDRGRFAGSLVEWDREERSYLRIVIPENWLNDPAIGEADIAYHLLVNWYFTQSLEGGLADPKGARAFLLEAEKKALGVMGPLAAQVSNPLLRQNIAQYRVASQYPPETTK